MEKKLLTVGLACSLGMVCFSSSSVCAEDRVISPLMTAANCEYNMAGLYYGTLPWLDSGSRRGEFRDLLNEHEIHAIRFPGGTPALTQFLVDHEALMRSVLGAAGYPEGDPQKVATLWPFLEFCKEADITPIYQVNTLLYAEGSTVYQMLGPANLLNNPLVAWDTNKRNAAATALTALVNQVRARGFILKHWELGNEEYGMNITARDYADLAVKFARAIHAADPEAMVWITLGDSVHGSWSQSLLYYLRQAGLTNENNIGFTLHYVSAANVSSMANTVRYYGFPARFAVTEFNPASNGEYWDLTPRYGLALALARFLVGAVPLPSLEVLCIHDLVSQNFGIFHYNQRSYGLPDMSTWDASLGYQAMPSAWVYRLFGKLIGGTILTDKTTASRLVVSVGTARRIFFVNDTATAQTLVWGRDVVGTSTTAFTCRTMLPDPANPEPDPLRIDTVKFQDEIGGIGAQGLSLTVPAYGIMYCRCFQEAPALYDNFTAADNAALDPVKWDVSAPAGTSVSVQGNAARIYSGAQWQTGSFTSKVGADFLAPGSVTSYSLQFREAYTMYGFRHIEIVGSAGSLILEWTTDWNGGFVNLYTLRTTGENAQTLWTGSREWDEGEDVTLTMTPTNYTLCMHDYKTNETWCNVTGPHGLAASDFAQGGFLRCLAYKNASDESIRFDDVQINYIGPVTLQGAVHLKNYIGNPVGAGISVELRQAGRTVKTARIFLDPDGSFAIPGIDQGTYDIVIEGDAWLSRTLPAVNVWANPTVLGPVELQGPDANGDNRIGFEDFAILQNSYGRTGCGGISAAPAESESAADTLGAANTSMCGSWGVVLITGLSIAFCALGVRD